MCGCKHWWLGPTFNADSSFWTWSLLYHCDRLYCIHFFQEQIYQIYEMPPRQITYRPRTNDRPRTICDWNSLYTLSRSKLTRYSPISSWHFWLLTPCTPVVTGWVHCWAFNKVLKYKYTSYHSQSVFLQAITSQNKGFELARFQQ